MTIKAYITDFAGVLAKDGFPSTISKYEKIYNIPTNNLQKVKNELWKSYFSLGKITEREFWYRCFKKVGIELNEEEINKISIDLRESHYPCRKMLDFFKNVNKKTGLLTNVGREWFEYWNKKYGLSKIFDVIVASYQLGLRKPKDSRIYTLTLEELSVEPNEAIFIDDQQKNIDAAERIGIKGVLFKDAAQAIHDIHKLSNPK